MSILTNNLRTPLLAAAAALAALGVGATFATGNTIITGGHWDFEVAYVGGDWDPHWHNHDTDDELDFADVVMTGVFDGTDNINGFDAPFPRPAGNNWDFTGATVGQLLYAFPASDPQPELPYIGLASEESDLGVLVNDEVTLRFDRVASGPAGGDFSLYTFFGGGPRPFFASAGDAFTFNGNNTLAVNVGSHSHYNLAFDTPGSYELVFEASGELVGGGTTSTGEFSVFFNVVPEPTSLAVLGLASAGLLARRRRR